MSPRVIFSHSFLVSYLKNIEDNRKISCVKKFSLCSPGSINARPSPKQPSTLATPKSTISQGIHNCQSLRWHQVSCAPSLTRLISGQRKTQGSYSIRTPPSCLLSARQLGDTTSDWSSLMLIGSEWSNRFKHREKKRVDWRSRHSCSFSHTNVSRQISCWGRLSGR